MIGILSPERKQVQWIPNKTKKTNIAVYCVYYTIEYLYVNLIGYEFYCHYSIIQCIHILYVAEDPDLIIFTLIYK